MNKEMNAAKSARELLLNEYHGILSTHSHDVPGYPFGSVMPYCLDENGQPVILISRIAQHTRNIQENPKVSLIISQSGVNDVHKGGRLTWLGDAQKVEGDEQLAERYYSFFPQSRDYHKTHDFDFYRISLVRARFIGGFGSIYWIKNDLMTRTNPFYGQAETGMVKHMNEDHVNAMVKYCNNADILIPEGVTPRMAGVDSEGMHLLLVDKVVRIAFPYTVEEPMAVRKTLVEMARAV